MLYLYTNAVVPAIWAAALNLGDFSYGVCRMMKVSIAEGSPSTGLSAQQTFYFSPDILVRHSEMPAMTASVASGWGCCWQYASNDGVSGLWLGLLLNSMPAMTASVASGWGCCWPAVMKAQLHGGKPGNSSATCFLPALILIMPCLSVFKFYFPLSKEIYLLDQTSASVRIVLHGQKFKIST